MEVAVYIPVAASKMSGSESTVEGDFPHLHFQFSGACKRRRISLTSVFYKELKRQSDTCWNGFYTTTGLTILGNHGNEPEFIGKCCKIMENAQ